MDDTPKKEVPSSCFICVNHKRYYKLGGIKTTELSKQISLITNSDFESFLSRNSSISYGICRTCTSQIKSAFELVELLKCRLNSETCEETGPRFKRLSKSPITPKLERISGSNKKSKTTVKSKRSLNVNPPPTNSVTSITSTEFLSSEHCYSKTDCEVVVLPQTGEHTYSKDQSKQGVKEFKRVKSVEILKKHIASDVECTSVNEEIAQIVVNNQVLLKAVERKILGIINGTCSSLSSRNVAFASVLSRYRSVGNLLQHGEHLLNEIIHEMSVRLPFVLDLLTMIVTGGKEPRENKVAPIAAAYAILMNGRCEKLSAWHRVTTMVAMKGQLDESGLKRLNHLSVTMSPATKLRLLDEAADCMDTGIVKQLSNNPLVKVTGDNLDIYIRTGHKSLEKSNSDLHLFASNLIFCRVARPDLYSNVVNQIELERLTPSLFLLHGHYMETLINSFVIILGRILVNMKAFTWIHSVLPAHIHHPYQQEMSVKSHVFQLPVMMKNETKHEDCVDILDNYEKLLVDVFEKAHGSDHILRQFKVPVGGDQLTRVRLEEAKHLRMLATTPTKRFEDLQPFIIELWHLKQDFLEKAYKELFNVKSLRQPGTLYHFKSKLQRSDVNGKVKGAFKPHYDLIISVDKQMIADQFLEYFGMENVTSPPTKNSPPAGIEGKSTSEKSREMHAMLRKFVSHYGYDKLLDRKKSSTDEVYNYSSNLCHWVLQLLQMEDIAKEGDMIRLIPSLMHCVPFFFSHSRLSKYFVECLDFILKCGYLLSPLQRIRVLEGAFTNLRGGLGNNIETDLVQENSVRNQKDMIRALGANKSEKAILRCTKAADTISQISEHVDIAVSLKKQASRHQKPRAERDETEIMRTLRQLRPFQKTDG